MTSTTAEEKTDELGNHIEMKKVWELLAILVVAVVVWNLPTSSFGIDELTVVQQYVVAIFVFTILSWLTECISAWATSLSIMSIMCVIVSENVFGVPKDDGIGELFDSKEIMAFLVDPIIMFFLMDFILAVAMSKLGLDTLLAYNLIRPFGNESESILLGFLFVIELFSMLISNTAIAALMLTFLTPVFAALLANDKRRTALTVSVPIAANLDGMETPIGTPPNLIATKYLNDPAGLSMNINFMYRMTLMAPFVIVLFLLSRRIIFYFFPFIQKTIHLKIDGEVHRGWCIWIVIVAFIVAILLWVTPKDVTGIDTNTASAIPMAISAITGVITAKDTQEINWSVIWMVAGGFAVGLGMSGSGLAGTAIESIPFGNWSPIAILAISGLICCFLFNFISNIVTVALLVLILTVVCRGMDHNLDGIGGASTILIGVAIAASTAMCLPISISPNTIAYLTGPVKQNDMLKVGPTSGVVPFILGHTLLYFIGQIHPFG